MTTLDEMDRIERRLTYAMRGVLERIARDKSYRAGLGNRTANALVKLGLAEKNYKKWDGGYFIHLTPTKLGMAILRRRKLRARIFTALKEGKAT